MRLKVSNVCQLLDKSKFPATKTVNGVTFTNNGDGTITANGTITTTENPATVHISDISLTKGNKYLVIGCPKSAGGRTWLLLGQIYTNDGEWIVNAIDRGSGTLFTAPSEESTHLSVFLQFWASETDILFKPQLFDLTEMFGAGNEPTTVAQFRQDFPNEMYEYSPECWKKFRRLKYVTETKNLFDISKVVETNYVKRSGGGLICSLYGTPIGKLGTICPSLKVGDTVTVSFKTVSAGVAGNFIQTDEHILRNGEKFTVSETGLTSQFYLYNTSYEYRDIPNKTTYYELQLELGSTATPYQPYGYLPLNRGKYIANKEPVQLLDKSKYNLPHTESGLTFTAGTDGSIIVNGTCTSTVWANISSFELNPEHTFILIGCPGTNVNDVALYTADAVTLATRQWEEGRGSLVTGNQYKNKNNYLMIRILAGYVCNNLTFKPQLFDLTEMYGAGHEPTTVAQFRQDFPNEMYDYNPYNAITFR